MSTHKKELSLPGVDEMLRIVIEKRPQLIHLLTDKTILEYLRPALEWKLHENSFPHADVLRFIISSHIDKLYGKESSQKAKDQLIESWAVETGAHLHVPRRHDHVTKKGGAQINSLLFQGQVVWALANKTIGNKVAISLNSGRVPLDNTNSGAYLDLPALKLPITLVSKNRYKESPESLIPATSQAEISQKIALLEMYRKQRLLSSDQHTLGMQVLNNFLRIQSNFSDQVATAHAFMLNKLLPIEQITLDSEFIGKDFMIALLKDRTSLTYSIFSEPRRRNQFLLELQNIRTGWSKESSPFDAVIKKGEDYKLANYLGDLTPEIIIKGLEEKTLWLTGVMKFFIFIAEGGLLSVGGWTQASYCTEIREKSVKLLKEFGYKDRAFILEKMPTHIAAAAPCWAIDEIDGNYQLLDAVKTILNPSLVDFTQIMQRTGEQSLLVALPTLYEFLTGKPPLLSYNELKETLLFAIQKSQ